MSVATAVVEPIKEGAKDVVKTPFKRPLLALTVLFLVVTFVLLVEAFKPGLITNPIRRALRAIGLKTA